MSPIAVFAKGTALLLLFHSAVSAQVASSEPKHWKSASPIGLGGFGFDLNQGLKDTVGREVLDTNTVALVAQSVRLTRHERTLFQIAPGPAGNEAWLYTLGNEWSAGCSRFADRLNVYAMERMDGHTPACLLAGLTNRPALDTIPDPDLRILATNYPLLPVSLFQKADHGTTTNQAGQVGSQSSTVTVVHGKLVRTNYTRIPRKDEVCRWASYTLADGDIGWQYVLRFAVDGTLESIDASKLDAKELDPRFRKVMQEADAEVSEELKQNGTFRRLGSVHTFWRLKQEKLKARGIDWRSPPELNRGTRYD